MLHSLQSNSTDVPPCSDETEQFSPPTTYQPNAVDERERDACALICAVRKGGQATHGNVKRTIEGLARMGHRTGYIDGEGDGVGILTDIPRQLWMKKLALDGLRSSQATERNFWVAHLMIPATARNRAAYLIEAINRQIRESGLHVLIEEEGTVNRQVLGPNAVKNEPAFWQIAGTNDRVPAADLDRTLFDLQVQLESDLDVHFASFSAHSVVYKVQGTVEILRRYYPELRDPDYASTLTLGHARYSTNTNPVFERVQPFNLLGHNGEFNTISRFRLETAMLGMPLDPGNSDSQDVDRTLQTLCMRYDLDLIEAMEYVFPPFEHDLIQNNSDIRTLYEQIRHTFGPFAQGPAAVAARLGDICVFSVDALGLRPLWFGETEKEYFVSSERGVYAMDAMASSPKPMAPGEKIAIRVKPGRGIEVLDYPAIQRHLLNRQRNRQPNEHDAPRLWSTGNVPSGGGHPTNGHGNGHGGYHQAALAEAVAVAVLEAQPESMVMTAARAFPWQERVTKVNTNTMAALGWERYHLSVIEALSETKKEQVGSLGWDGPLAALSHTRVNVADYFKETVAVVTNPAIDRERERAQFSTQVLLGVRPVIGQSPTSTSLLVKLDIPLLLGGHPDLGTVEDMRAVASKLRTMTIEDLAETFGKRLAYISMSAALDENFESAIQRIQNEAVELVLGGVQCIVLDDTAVFSGECLWLDPLIVTAAVDRALRQHEATPNLRRQTGIVVRSGSLRDLHDLALCIGLGANALLPYAMYAVGLGLAPRAPKELPDATQRATRLSNMVTAAVVGLQKITSTIGCHELRGYGQAFSSIGLAKNVAQYLGTTNYFGSEARGLTWSALKDDAEERAAEMRGEKGGKLDNPDRFYPKMWKKIEDVAHGEMSLEQYTQELMELEDKQPVAIRHILSLKTSEYEVDPDSVDISMKGHSMPVLIGAMSFGSQGELAYKAYAEAAYRLNIICVNGEGGELPDIMGRYPRNRGQQVASARFGVNIEFLNSCNLLEIKIGQGAKPGEGGQLPGYKVTEQVAAARHTTPGVDLISPSNNHDLYSIEDLAQLIDELKTANPRARVSVKIPVVPGVGIIAVGVAKAGADIINITGYEGGTGAARAHSLRHVGLPAEIGVWQAHRALVESGLRENVELWCDGGMKSGRDVIKMLCLGANRVGFGTLAMVAVGCTICRKCHEGTCHVGITTHIKTKEEALLKGIKHFDPRDSEIAVEGICNVFHMLGDDIRKWTAKLGFTRVQDLVGRGDLLEQLEMHDRIDLSDLLRRVPYGRKKQHPPGGPRLTRPRNTLSRQITAVVAEHVQRGEYELTYDDEQVMAMDRALGTHLAGALKRADFPNADLVEAVHLSFSNSAVPGNGLGAFLDAPIDVLVEGGAQDGAAKGARAGTMSILKGLNHNGKRLDGSVGKSFAYGAVGGQFIVQGNADTRACIRLSGADVIFGGEVTEPLQDHLGGLAARANIKGYACEYMTSGRVLIMGDPGPWMCAGMSGGVLYQRIQPEMNLTEDAIRRRIAIGATVEISTLDEKGVEDVQELLNMYIQTLEVNNQAEATQHLYTLLRRPQDHFVKIAPPTRAS
jgi:glutamate synthase (NADPH/NADH) large chain